MFPPVAKGLRPWRMRAGPWCSGRTTAINGDEATIEVMAEHGHLHNYIVSTSVFRAGAVPTLNGAVAVKFNIAPVNDPTPIADRVVQEVVPVRFLGLIEHTPERPNWATSSIS